MSTEWNWVRLGDCCEKIGSGATPKGGKDAYLEVGPYRLIRSQNIYNDGFYPAGLVFISDDQAQKLDGVAVQQGDVLLNITGDSVARVCLALAQYLPARVNQHVAIIRPASKTLDSRFLRYFLASPYQQNLMLGLAGAGATRSALTKGMIEDFKVPYPSLATQSAISDILSALDNRISLLRDTNATLEAIARALFKSWFVNFDPVRAKVEGLEPEGMDAITAALFPDSFEESELGLVPRGWRVGQIGDELRIAYGKNLPTTRLLEEGFPVFGGNGQIGFFSEYLYESRQVIVACRGAASGKINQSSPKAFGTNNSLILEKTKNLPFSYLKGFMKNSDLVPYVTGSAQPQVTIDNLKVFKILVPTESVVTCFESIAGLIEDQIEQNNCQAQTLTQLRDTLLPRLISGQLLLPEVEASVENMLSEAV